MFLNNSINLRRLGVDPYPVWMIRGELTLSSNLKEVYIQLND